MPEINVDPGRPRLVVVGNVVGHDRQGRRLGRPDDAPERPYRQQFNRPLLIRHCEHRNPQAGLIVVGEGDGLVSDPLE